MTFIPHFTPIVSGGNRPDTWIVILHGIFGQGTNWRAFARQLCQEDQSRGVFLVDLRMHGRSLAAPGPHTLESAASDVLALIEAQQKEGKLVTSVLGHSFGGKVALEMMRQCPTSRTSWIVDSSPSKNAEGMTEKNNIVVSVLRMLQTMEPTFPTREYFIENVQSRGFPLPLAQWLAMNLESKQDGNGTFFRNRLCPDSMESLLVSYFKTGLWPVVENGSANGPLHFIKASRGSALSERDAERLKELCAQGKLFFHELEGGHWLHMDARESMATLISTG